MNQYSIGYKYQIAPFAKDKFYEAVFVGDVSLGSATFPVFNFDFYSYEPKSCFMALNLNDFLEADRSIEGLISKIKQKISYVGNGYKLIQVGPRFLTVEDFKNECSGVDLKEDHINLCISNGKYIQKHQSNGGEIKTCPKCNVLRNTSCSACGCGICETCGFRWTCMPVKDFQFVDTLTTTRSEPKVISKFSFEDSNKLETHLL